MNERPVSTKVRILASNFASLISVTVCFPLEVIKTRMHIQVNAFRVIIQGSKGVNNHGIRNISKLVKTEGVRGLFRGYSISAFCTPFFHTLYFPLYEQIKLKFKSKFLWEENSFKLYSIAAAIAGITCNIITNPFWVVRTRMQSEIFRSICEKNYEQKYPNNMFKTMLIISR